MTSPAYSLITSPTTHYRRLRLPPARLLLLSFAFGSIVLVFVLGWGFGLDQGFKQRLGSWGDIGKGSGGGQGKASDGALKLVDGKYPPEPAISIWTNLRDDKGYLLVPGSGAGWTNALFVQLKREWTEVLDFIPKIHIAKLSNRIPIIPPTIPSRGHLEGDHETSNDLPFILMSEIFDLPRFSKSIDLPIVELEELKYPRYRDVGWKDKLMALKSNFGNRKRELQQGLGKREREEEGYSEWETIGCWGLEMTSRNVTHESSHIHEGKLELVFTPLPSYIIDPKFPIPDGHALIASLGEAIRYDRFGIDRASEGIKNHLSGKSGELEQFKEWHPDFERPIIEPDRRLSCIDNYIYYTFPKAEFDIPPWLDREDYEANTWTRIGRFLRWREDVQELADMYLRKGWGLKKREKVPPYVSVHIRRTDLMWGCKADDGSYDPACLSAPVFKVAVDRIRSRIKERKGIDIEDRHVVFTTDDHDPEYLSTLTDMGWLQVDHTEEGTADRLGVWWPTILDAVFLGGGTGFVGTRGSTMTEIAMRRVEDWQDGIVMQVKQWDRVDNMSEDNESLYR